MEKDIIPKKAGQLPAVPTGKFIYTGDNGVQAETVEKIELHQNNTYYINNAEIVDEDAPSDFPKIIGLTPYRQTDYFVGRDDTVNFVTDYLLQRSSCYLYGIGGIGKTEIAKGVYKRIMGMPKSESGITHIL